MTNQNKTEEWIEAFDEKFPAEECFDMMPDEYFHGHEKVREELIKFISSLLQKQRKEMEKLLDDELKLQPNSNTVEDTIMNLKTNLNSK